MLSMKNAQRHVNSLMVMCTYACQFECSYCEVVQSKLFMSLEILYKAIDLLLTTQSRECQLRFWGGEPLLRWNLIKKGIRYGEEKAKEKDKKIKFMITTNGLLLNRQKLKFLKNHPVEIMFSLDGNKECNSIHRFLKSGKEVYDKLLLNLKLLTESGLPYFVNMVVSPLTVNNLSRNLTFLKDLKVNKVQFCYQCGIFWSKEKMGVLINELKKFIVNSKDHDFLMNFINDCEPTMLSQELLVDTDGRFYFDAAVFMEKKFARLRDFYFMANVHEVDEIDSLYHSKSDLFSLFRNACSKEQKKVFLNNISLGLKLENFFNSFSHESLRSNEHPLLIPILKGSFYSQVNVLKKLDIGPLFLYIEGSCLNNCLFCRQKEEKFSELFKIEAKLKDNVKFKREKLCIIGNEPLLHPQVIQIIELAKKCGFKKIEIMTSGEYLCDKNFSREVIRNGVSSLSLPLFCHEGKVHDFIVGREGSFSLVMRGIDNVLSFGARIFVHTNLIKQNIDYLKDLEKFVKKKLKLPFVILPIRPKSANLSFANLMPSYTEIIKKLYEINALLGFPICIVKRIQKKILLSGDNISDSMKLYLLDQRFFKAQICKVCSYLNRCPGLFKEYIQTYGSSEINPP